MDVVLPDNVKYLVDPSIREPVVQAAGEVTHLQIPSQLSLPGLFIIGQFLPGEIVCAECLVYGFGCHISAEETVIYSTAGGGFDLSRSVSNDQYPFAIGPGKGAEWNSIVCDSVLGRGYLPLCRKLRQELA